MTLSDLMRLPWGWQGPTEVQDSQEGAYFELRIAELPEFFVAGRSREEVLAQSTSALASFLQSYLDTGEMPPLPANQSPSWLVGLHRVQIPKSLPRPPKPGDYLITA